MDAVTKALPPLPSGGPKVIVIANAFDPDHTGPSGATVRECRERAFRMVTVCLRSFSVVRTDIRGGFGLCVE